ncbi:hypothetical protein EDEG_03590 [Edhazardia aedis USNM 41457]|uniref:Uncharacterized protein n=1 Tax=Edhazardia aedis (strain USNM 41457) TaxID=1003232 RepID=J9D272_EDHAE|nr:hypothetical protein EDEG_03590 [Edhazardia aedis USNM 41457]|eukprot:EJW01946.1 hypothetical protein EDEG_03590 [Edhazardia aedis USNM 41457]
MKICLFDSMKCRKIVYVLALFLLMFFSSFKNAISISTSGTSQSQMRHVPNNENIDQSLIGSDSANTTTQKSIQSIETIAVLSENKNEKEESNLQQSIDKSIKTDSSDIKNTDVINFDPNSPVIIQDEPIQTDIMQLKPLNLKALKDFITNNDNTIFENYDVFELFDILSKINDVEQVFYWKGKLHKQFANYDLFKKIVEEKFSYHIKNYLEADLKYISAVYDHHMYFKKAYNKLNKENPSSDSAVYEFCKKEVELRPESVFSTEKTAFQENMVFVKKFNGIFDLFWKKFFLVLKEDKRIAPLDDVMLKFYNINTKMSIPYDSFDYIKLNFGNIKRKMGVDVNVGSRDNLDINIILSSMTSHTNSRVNHFNPIFVDYLFLTRLDRFIFTCNDFTLSSLYIKEDGKLRYSQAGIDLINKVSMFVRKRLSQLFESFVDNSTIQFQFGPCGELGEPENDDATNIYDKNNVNDKTDASFVSTKQIKPRRDELNVFVYDWTACKLPKSPKKCNDCINGVNVHAGLYPDESVHGSV